MEDGLKHRQVDLPGGFQLHIPNHQPSFTQVLRAAKRQEHGLFNCIASIAHDSQFVEEVAASFPGLPLLANLRCGLWYVPRPAATCYFKSTDGHSGHWAFSTTRLNLHVALTAARNGGVVIVDATRRGKTFPDALTKTVPIWAAVLNRAVQRLQSGGTAAWDGDVHLPPWISANEQNQIRQRLPVMEAGLAEVGADLSELASVLRKPLRCLWVSQEPDEEAQQAWQQAARGPDGLPFTPVVLVTASIPNARVRRRLRLPAASPPVDLMYEYVPGAGDDEESWAQGLTPPVLWAGCAQLLRAGPGGVAVTARRLIDAHHRDGGLHLEAVQGNDEPASPCWIGNSRLGLGSADTLGMARIWEESDAVLAVCGAPHPSMAFEPSSAVREQAGGAVLLGDTPTRYLWLPIASTKEDKHALLHRLPAAVQFASHHLAAGRRVLVAHSRDGAEVGVSVLLACLLACFSVEDDGEGRAALRWAHPAALLPGSCALRPATPEYSRVEVRRYLAALAQHLRGGGVPGKGMLKQVYNAFLCGRMTACQD